MTKSKIVNLEQGRKSDITITEACLLVARALGIPVLALVCDIDRPFREPDLVGFDGWHNTDLFALLLFRMDHMVLCLRCVQIALNRILIWM